MPPRSRKIEQQREREQAYLGEFLTRLGAASTVAGALALLAVDAMPRESGTGRHRHTNLVHFMGAFEQTNGTPPFRLKRGYPIVPGGATAAERAAYAGLADRLANAGEISAADAEQVEAALAAVQPSLRDYL